MPNTLAYQRFIDSMKLDFDKWHDGIGFDLSAIPEMTDDERQSIAAMLRDGNATWREVEALAALDLPEARAGVEEASQHHLSIDTRLAAADAKYRAGRLSDAEFDAILAREIRNLSSIPDGSVRALLLAEDRPSDVVKQALLWASYNRTECSMHCAALLCFLVGKAKEPFDWDLRPLFLRLGPHNSYFERKAAFDELCKLVGMEIQEVHD